MRGAVVEVERERLFARLDEPIPLVILEGIRGAGKRTLLRRWCAVPSGDSVRALVELDERQPSLPAVLAQFLRVLERQGVVVPREAYQRLVAARDREDAFAAFESVIQPLGRVEFALIGYERLPADVFSGLAGLHRRLPRLRVLMETIDAAPAVRRAAADGLPLITIHDDELALDLDEVRFLLRGLGREPAPGAAEALLAATGGHAGLVAAALRTAPDDCLAGTVDRPRLLQQWWEWPTTPLPLEQHVLWLARLPRFTLAEAKEFTGAARNAEFVERMAALGLVGRRPHPRLDEPAFGWDEELRRAVLGLAGRVEAPAPAADDFRRLAEAARKAGDLDLTVVAHLRADDLDAAEAVVRRVLDAVPASGDLALWEPLVRLAPSRLARHPGLLLAGTLLTRTAGTAGGVASQLSDLARRLAGTRPDDPLERLWLLAIAARAACEADDLVRALNLARRWGRLAQEVPALLATRVEESVAMGTGMLRVLLQLDLLPEAAQAAQQVVDLAVGDVVDDQPLAGRWLATAQRTLRCTGTVLDHAGAAPAPGLVPPLQASDTELDELLVAVQQGWGLLDAGDIDGADRLTRRALARCANPTRWPVLLLTRSVALICGRRQPALEKLRASHLDTPAWRGRQGLGEWVGATVALLDLVVPLALHRRLPPHPRHADPGQVVELVRRYLDDTTPSRLGPDELAALPPRVRLGMLGLEALRALRAGDPGGTAETLAVLCAELPESPVLPLALASAATEEIDRLAALHEHPGCALAGHLVAARQLAAALPPGPSAVELSERERELLARLRRGDRNQRIAEALFVSVNTVKFHRANLYRKLGASTREEALAAALRLGY